jgi:hypothetical protein
MRLMHSTLPVQQRASLFSGVLAKCLSRGLCHYHEQGPDDPKSCLTGFWQRRVPLVADRDAM